jgi:hypothetical protein
MPGQPLQITLNVCSPSPPSSNVPIDVIAWAHICYQANFGDLGYLGYYPAGQSNATITITIPALLQPNMCSSGTYNGVLNLSLTFEDPRGASNFTIAIPLTFVFPGTTPTPTPTSTPTPTPTPLGVSNTILIVGGIAAAVTIGLLALFLWGKK